MKKFLLLFILIAGIGHKTQAAGLSVKPAELKVQGLVNNELVTRLLITNLSKDVALFEIYPDNLESLIKVMPASFVLEADAKKEVLVKIMPKENGQFQNLLSVVSRPLTDDSFNASSGVKIPLTIIAENKYYESLASLAAIKIGRGAGITLISVLFLTLFFSMRAAIRSFKIRVKNNL